MATSATSTTSRKNPPLCARCSHSKSFHAKGSGQCKAIGCKGCEAYVEMKRKQS